MIKYLVYNNKLINFGAGTIVFDSDTPGPGPEPTSNTYVIYPDNDSLALGVSEPTGWFTGKIGSRLQIALTEPDDTNPGIVPNFSFNFEPQSFTDHLYLYLEAKGGAANETIADIVMPAESNPTLTIAFSDTDGNRSNWIDIGRNGSSGSGKLIVSTNPSGSVDSKANYILPSTEVTSYLTNIDITKICTIHISLFWSSTTEWKERTKGLKFYNIIIADTPIEISATANSIGD